MELKHGNGFVKIEIVRGVTIYPDMVFSMFTVLISIWGLMRALYNVASNTELIGCFASIILLTALYLAYNMWVFKPKKSGEREG